VQLTAAAFETSFPPHVEAINTRLNNTRLSNVELIPEVISFPGPFKNRKIGLLSISKLL
jgi:hypothetical protein